MNRSLAAVVLAALACAGRAEGLPPVTGVIWQLYETAPDARGSWHRLGARELLIQWTAVDGTAFIAGTGQRQSEHMPDWGRIARAPWAASVIVGLSGRFDEQATRRSIDAMVAESLVISRQQFPFRVSGWYFPAEVDPYWKDAPSALPPALARLPRPLWISVYDGEGMGADEFAAWIASWMPRDVGVMFQDGVGVGVRSAPVARQYADALAARLDKARVAVIAEAFRTEAGKFRAATAAELRAQLPHYREFPIYLFDGPHYVPDSVVEELLRQ